METNTLSRRALFAAPLFALPAARTLLADDDNDKDDWHKRVSPLIGNHALAASRKFYHKGQNANSDDLRNLADSLSLLYGHLSEIGATKAMEPSLAGTPAVLTNEMVEPFRKLAHKIGMPLTPDVIAKLQRPPAKSAELRTMIARLGMDDMNKRHVNTLRGLAAYADRHRGSYLAGTDRPATFRKVQDGYYYYADDSSIWYDANGDPHYGPDFSVTGYGDPGQDWCTIAGWSMTYVDIALYASVVINGGEGLIAASLAAAGMGTVVLGGFLIAITLGTYLVC